MTTNKIFAEKLLQINALKLSPQDPFTWASGWHSPIYCDNRKILSYPHTRDYVKSELANCVLENFPDAEILAGVATAGIAHGALAADLLRLPYIYVRSKPKDHGLGNQIEGVLTPGQKVVVVEDLISTGKSSLEAIEAVRIAGGEVIGLCALFTYNFPQSEIAFKEANVPFVTLSDYNALIELAQQDGTVDEATLASLANWRNNPEMWKG